MSEEKRIYRILLVEDDEDLRFIIKMMLGNHGYEVVSATNGFTALALLNDTFDIILTDIVMPELDGLELIQVIKDKKLDVICIAITGYPKENIPKDIPLLRKPFSSTELITFIEKVISERISLKSDSETEEDKSESLEDSENFDDTDRKKILLVEDDRKLSLITKKLLESENFDVSTAVNGNTALQLYDDTFNLVITEIVMPEMGGEELIRNLRERNPNVKCIAFSRSSNVNVPEDVQVILKPISDYTLIDSISRTLDLSYNYRRKTNKGDYYFN
jgi:CheY-like chemotaxis protein